MTLRAAVVAFVGLVAAGCSGGDGKPSREACARMRDHVAALATGPAAGLSAEQRESHRANLARGGGEDYLEQCVRHRSDEYVECALAARTLEELERCRQ